MKRQENFDNKRYLHVGYSENDSKWWYLYNERIIVQDTCMVFIYLQQLDRWTFTQVGN